MKRDEMFIEEEEEDCREITYSKAVNIKRSSISYRNTHSLQSSPTPTPNNFHTSHSWTEESKLMKENRYSPKSSTPLKERRKFSFLKPINIKEQKGTFKPDYNLNNLVKIKENTNVTKLVLIKKKEETKTPMSEKTEAENLFGPYLPNYVNNNINTIKRGH